MLDVSRNSQRSSQAENSQADKQQAQKLGGRSGKPSVFTPELKYKDIPLANTLKDIDGKRGIIEGYFSTKYVIDSWRERVVDGAFKRTFKNWGPEGKDRIKPLYQHMPTMLLGKAMELVEDEIGARHVTKFSETSLAKDVFKLIEDQVITEHSFGYDLLDWAPADESDDENHDGELAGVIDLKEVRVWEYSFVTWGANMQTPILDVKSLWGHPEAKDVALEQLEVIEKSLRTGEWNTDEIPFTMELFVKMVGPVLRDLAHKQHKQHTDKQTEPNSSQQDPQNPQHPSVKEPRGADSEKDSGGASPKGTPTSADPAEPEEKSAVSPEQLRHLIGQETRKALGLVAQQSESGNSDSGDSNRSEKGRNAELIDGLKEQLKQFRLSLGGQEQE